MTVGANVVGKDGNVLGTIDYVMRNPWTGEVQSYIVQRQVSHTGLGHIWRGYRHIFLSAQNVVEATECRVRINVTSDELSENA